MADSTVLPAGGPTREEIAKIEIGQTTVSPAVARGLFAFFIVCIVAVPFVEIVGARRIADVLVSTVWSRLAGIPTQISAAVQAETTKGHTSLWRRAVTANRAAMSGLVDFENALEDESILGRSLRPPAQWVLSGWLGAGNERVYVGRDRWLFYRPDLEYLTGPGFLENEVLRRRIRGASEWTVAPQPDPRPAILAFHRQLAARGIALVLVPTPVKPGVHPEKLAGSTPAGRGALQNPSYAELVTWLGSQGVLTFDPSDVLGEARQSGAQYLVTDTHWRPESMELVASRLAAFVGPQVNLPPAAPPGYRIEEREVTSTGDTAAMLDLPAWQKLYPPEKVLVSRVLAQDGSAWRPDRAADILVLGDSFANIYSLASMGWGDSAGLVEHLSYALGRPVDRIVQNDAAAFATREMLQRSGPARLDGKRVVIWQFAARELSFGDWRVIE
jgi:SGNH hydrolase-like domain, acetyltransferase AlgX